MVTGDSNMSKYQYVFSYIPKILMGLICGYSISVHAGQVGSRHQGATELVGRVVSTPCSIVMKNRYQTVDFSSLTLTMLSTQAQRNQKIQPFEIELRDCGSLYSSLDSKTWLIRFEGQHVENMNIFSLRGASQGLGISVLDKSMNILIPSHSYPLLNNELQKDKLGNSLLLNYFLRLELTGKPIQAGSYKGLIRFFIDYK